MLPWYATPLFVSAALMLAIGIFQVLVHRWNREGEFHLGFSLFCAFAAVHALGAAIATSSETIMAARWGHSLRWIGLCVALLGLVRFTSRNCGLPRKTLGRVLGALCAIPALWWFCRAVFPVAIPGALLQGPAAANRAWPLTTPGIPMAALVTIVLASLCLAYAAMDLQGRSAGPRTAHLGAAHLGALLLCCSDFMVDGGLYQAPLLLPYAWVWLAWCGLDTVGFTVSALRARGDNLERLVQQRTVDLRRAQTGLVQTEKLASVGLVAAGVAHEVNNPAAYVLTNLTLLREAQGSLARHRKALSACLQDQSPASLASLPLGTDDVLELERQSEESVRDAMEGIRRVRDIVADLKSLSHTSAEGVTGVQLHKLVEACVSVTSPTVKHRLEICLSLQPTPPIEGLPGPLGQLVINLLLNAAEAVPGSSAGQVTVRTGLHDGEVMLEVSDRGPGIATADLDRIFEPMYTTKGKARGLGLAICRRIAEEHGGRIEVETVVNEGATFRVLVPMNNQVHVPSSYPDLDLSSLDGAAPSTLPEVDEEWQVLIVDDETLLLKIMLRLVGRRYRVHGSCSVDDALKQIADGLSPDLILCDLMMPGKNGAELFRALCDSHPHLARRMTFMTGGGISESISRFVRSAGRPVLDKPIEHDLLFDHLASQLALLPRNANLDLVTVGATASTPDEAD